MAVARHKTAMRRLIPAALLLVAACSQTPAPQPVQAGPVPSQSTDGRHDHRTLNGMTARDLTEHFGRPRIQVREGDGLKIQFAGTACVLDAYLYPSEGGVARVTHIEARNSAGMDVSTQSCVYSLEDR